MASQKLKPAKHRHRMNILVAEDTPFNQKFIKRLLERWGHSAVIVENGRQVIEKLQTDDFDVILMDVQMPEMDGYEATQAIREAEGTNDKQDHIPIVAMTAHAIKGDRERCLEAGMDEYLSKPISSGKLYDIIDNIGADVSARQGYGEHNVDGEQDLFNFLAIDKKMIEEAFDQDWDFFREVVDLFVTDYPQMIEGLNLMLASGDAVAFSRYAHSIKGMVRLFKAEQPALLAETLEIEGKAGDLSGVSEMVDRLSDSLKNLESSLLSLLSQPEDNFFENGRK